MDPLSVTASVITIATTVAQLIKGVENLKILKRAPKQVYEVVDELADLQAVLDNISHLDQQLPQGAEFKTIVTKLEKALAELDKTIKDGLWADLSSTSKLRAHKARIAWMRNESKFESSRKQIREQRASLLAFIAAGTHMSSNRVELMVTDVKLLVDRSAQINQNFEQLMLQKLDDHNAAISKLSDNSMPKAQLQAAIDQLVQQGQAATTTPTSNGLGSPSPHPITALCVEAVRLRHFETYCPCSCHPRKRVQTPQLTDRFLGGFFVGYSGRPAPLVDCEYCACRKKRPQALYIRYYFPWWMCTRHLSFILATNIWDGPKVAMEFPRTISNVAPLIQLTKTGDLRGIRRLFEEGQASIKDITSDFGSPALLFAFSYDKPDVARFLIEQGADPLTENKLQATAADVAWTRILGEFIDADLRAKYLEILGPSAKTVMLARKRFTKIHKLVLGLASGGLQNELDRHRNLINNADSGGFTALGWSAARGDVATLEALLLHNAKIYVPGVAQSDALNCAMASRSPACIKPLLRAGADANTRSEFGETALHIAAMRHDDPQNYMAPLLEHGANVDAQDNMGFTALCYAVQFGRAESVRYLATRGADLNISNNAGLNAIGLAIIENAHEILQDLLVFGAKTSYIFPGGQTILHLAAEHGDMATIDILEIGELTVDPNIQNRKGLTCKDTLRLRLEADAAAATAPGDATTAKAPTEAKFDALRSSIANRLNNFMTTSSDDQNISSTTPLVQAVRGTQRLIFWLCQTFLPSNKSCLVSTIDVSLARTTRRSTTLAYHALILLLLCALSQHLYARPALHSMLPSGLIVQDK